MTTVLTESNLNLPLSWTRREINHPEFNTVQLPYSGISWIPTADIPHHLPIDELYKKHLKEIPNGVVLQSVSLSLRNYLIEQGFQSAPMGGEAVLDLPWRGKRSVRELARRGRRHGAVREIPFNPIYQGRIKQLMKTSPSRQGKQLRYTERTGFDAGVRAFVFESEENQWLGAVTLSRPSPTYMHTEMILRHNAAPVGIMEALISAIAQQLETEGIKQLSLGNVLPVQVEMFDTLFGPYRRPNEQWLRSKMAVRLGRSLNFAFNADGLWRFKDKFQPRWEPTYIVASPGLSLITLAGMMQASGYIDLVQEKVLTLWPLPAPFPSVPVPATRTREKSCVDAKTQ